MRWPNTHSGARDALAALACLPRTQAVATRAAKRAKMLGQRVFVRKPTMLVASRVRPGAAFKACFTAIGKEWPEHFGTLESEAARYMGLNNTVVLSVRCWGAVATRVTVCVALGVIGVAVAARHAIRR
jgi:hypothetical protein